MERARNSIASGSSRKSRKHRAQVNNEAATVKRRKSRSPSRPKHSSNSVRFDPFGSNRSSKAISDFRQSSASANASNAIAVSSDNDMPFVDRGKRVKALLPSSSRLSENVKRPNDADAARNGRKDGTDTSSGKQSERAATMAALTAECERLRKENEVLKQTVHDGKKVLKKRDKTIDDLKDQISRNKIVKKDQDAQIQTLKAKQNTHEQLVSSIESSMQCQICMELLARPYALSPCGHILCMSCLKDWFRKAPPSQNDLDMDMDDPDYIMHREKSCPCCRAAVIRRPVPIFVVKSIVSVIMKAKAADSKDKNGRVSLSPPPTDEDPWKGLFPDEEDFYSAEEDEEDYSDDYDYDEEDDEDGIPFFPMHPFFDEDGEPFSDGSAEDEAMEEYSEGDQTSSEEGGEVAWVRSRWVPPILTDWPLHLHDPADNPVTRMIIRGCSYGMIMNYLMEYTHANGLVAYVSTMDVNGSHRPSGSQRRNTCHRLHLGWTIMLNPLDESGDIYIEDCIREISHEPETWDVLPRPQDRGVRAGLLDVRRLVLEDEIEDYNTTDTEEWLLDP